MRRRINKGLVLLPLARTEVMSCGLTSDIASDKSTLFLLHKISYLQCLSSGSSPVEYQAPYPDNICLPICLDLEYPFCLLRPPCT